MTPIPIPRNTQVKIGGEQSRVHKSFSTRINNTRVGIPYISRNDPIHTAAPPPLSAHHNGLLNAQDSNLLQRKTTRETVICYFTNQQTKHPTCSRLQNHSYKLCRITNCKAGSPAKPPNKSRNDQDPDSIPLPNGKEEASPKAIKAFTAHHKKKQAFQPQRKQ